MRNRNDMAKVSTCRDELLRPQSPGGPTGWCFGREGRFNAATPEGQK
jgi:hypothetical protein